VSGELHVVTGAFGYSGQRIASRLLASGHRVRTLTHSPQRANPFGMRVEARPFDFEHPERLEESLRGAAVLYNTYWVRFNHRDFSYARAVENTRAMFAAARRAGVGRIVHVSITNPSEDSPLEYFRGKAVLERELRDHGIPHSILRPAVLFGGEDILINNIAWVLRRLPVVGIFGDGRYRLEPIHVEDLAALAVSEARESGNRTLDAIGPETFTYRELLEELCSALGLRRWFVPVPPWLGVAAGWLLGWWMRDVLITRDEIVGLMQGLLYTGSEPLGTTRLSVWARENAASLGVRYATELGRRRDRRAAYREIGS
jgi:NADH dehydrogenase